MKKLLSYISMALVISLLVNMLPMSVLAEKLQEITADTEIVTNATEENPEETTQEEIISEDAHVVAEIMENRTEFSKEFLLSNGLHMAMVYADAVHFETESGWEEIDNTLKTNADGSYSNTAGVWDVTFPDQLGEDESVIIEKDGYTLSFFMSGALTSEGAAIMSAGLSNTPLQAFGVTDAQIATGQIQQVDISAIVEAAEHPETVPGKLQSRIAYADVYAEDVPTEKCKKHVTHDCCEDGVASIYCKSFAAIGKATITKKSLVKLTQTELDAIIAATDNGLHEQYTLDNYIYMVDINGNPIPFYGIRGDINQGTDNPCIPLADLAFIIVVPIRT